LALARVRIKQGLLPTGVAEAEPSQPSAPWLVARVCSEYVSHCKKAAATGRLHPEHVQGITRTLNEFCRYCGALPVAELKRGYVSEWVESVPSWRSPVTLLTAFQSGGAGRPNLVALGC
jgi:hypothetical protein